jgi:hypothetical protein
MELLMISVTERLPEESGDYLCIRYGMSHAPESISFTKADPTDSEDRDRWFDRYVGGCHAPRYCELNNAEKYWRSNYGKVLYWFELPINPFTSDLWQIYMNNDLANQNIDPTASDGTWISVNANGEKDV